MAVKKQLEIVIGVLDKFSTPFRKMDLGLKKALVGVKKLGAGLKKLTLNVGRQFKRMGFAVSAAFVGMAYQGDKFSKGFAEVMTLLDDASLADGLKKGLHELALEIGATQEELVGGLYQALSKGIPPNNAIDFLRTSAKAAVGGVTTVETAVNGMTSVLNSWRMGMEESDRVADVMFATVKNGGTTFEELASSMSIVAPVASQLGVPLEEVAGAVAMMTASGKSTSVAMREMRQAMVSTSKVLGDGWSKSMSLQEGFQAVTDAGGNSLTKLLEMQVPIEAINALFDLTGKNAKKAMDLTAAAFNSSGAAQKAFLKIDKIRTYNKFLSVLRTGAIRVGVAFNKGVAPALNRVSKAMGSVLRNASFSGLTSKVNEFATVAEKTLTNVAKLVGDVFKGGEEGAKAGTMLKEAFKSAAAGVGESAVAALALAAPMIGNAIGTAAVGALKSPREYFKSRGKALDMATEQVGGANLKGMSVSERFSTLRTAQKSNLRQMQNERLRAKGVELASSINSGGFAQAVTIINSRSNPIPVGEVAPQGASKQ